MACGHGSIIVIICQSCEVGKSTKHYLMQEPLQGSQGHLGSEIVKSRLKEYNQVIRSLNGKVTPVIGGLDLLLEVNGESKVIRVKVVSELDHVLIRGIDF